MKVATAERRMTLAEAADQWEDTKRKIDELKPQLEQAAEVLKEHFKKTGRNTYKDRISYSEGSRVVLDQEKVRAYLGKKLGTFQKRIKTSSLSLLK